MKQIILTLFYILTITSCRNSNNLSEVTIEIENFRGDKDTITLITDTTDNDYSPSGGSFVKGILQTKGDIINTNYETKVSGVSKYKVISNKRFKLIKTN